MRNPCSKLMQVPLGPPPRSTSKHVANVMKANLGKGTGPELRLRKALWKEGIRGYRLNWNKALGRPDICFPGRKMAIFVHGCFWHRCPNCNIPLPKSNATYWRKKFVRNVQRDRLKTKQLRDLGWHVVVVWECKIQSNLDTIVAQIKDTLKSGADIALI